MPGLEHIELREQRLSLFVLKVYRVCRYFLLYTAEVTFDVAQLEHRGAVFTAEDQRLGGVAAGGEIFLRHIQVTDDVLYDVLEIFF